LLPLDVAQHNKTKLPKSHIILSRNQLALNSLFASALILTLLNPLILWDVGFLLSFVANLGLIVLVPPLEWGIFDLPNGGSGPNRLA